MKPSDNKLRGGGNSALTQLKARCLREFEQDGSSATLDQVMLWASEIIERGDKKSTRTNAEIRQLIGEFYEIQLSRDTQLSSFYGWVKLTRKTHEREARIQQWLECEKLEHPELTDQELHRRGQRKFKLLSIAEDDPDSWATILGGETRAAQKDRELNLAERKFAETKKDEQTKALELCLEEAKAFPDVHELFKQAFAALKKAKGKK